MHYSTRAGETIVFFCAVVILGRITSFVVDRKLRAWYFRWRYSCPLNKLEADSPNHLKTVFAETLPGLMYIGSLVVDVPRTNVDPEIRLLPSMDPKYAVDLPTLADPLIVGKILHDTGTSESPKVPFLIGDNGAASKTIALVTSSGFDEKQLSSQLTSETAGTDNPVHNLQLRLKRNTNRQF
jgi:hypothetical protein